MISKTLTLYARRFILSAIVGVLAGVAATACLVALQLATTTREHHPILIWFLPIAGLLTGILYHTYGQSVVRGHNLILDEIHDPKSEVPLRLTPLMLLSATITHLFGGSAGREGAMIQMGAGLADKVSAIFKLVGEERKILLVAGLSAGFAAGIGAPLAGAIFGMEVLHTQAQKFRLFAWFECLVASLVGYAATHLLHAPHAIYPQVNGILFSWQTLALVIAFGGSCGVIARIFVLLTHSIEHAFQKYISWQPLRPALAGVILIGLYQLEGSHQFAGLGLPIIQKAFASPASLTHPIWKAILTSITVGSGFKGGEFVPLVFIGSTFGSAISFYFNVSTLLFAALGFVAVFSGASNTPLACTILAIELFGPEVGGYALLACFLSYACSGRKGIYKSQR